MKVLLIVFALCVQTFCIDTFIFLGKKKLFDHQALAQAIVNKCANVDNIHQFENFFSDLNLCQSRALREFSIKFDHYENNADFCTSLKESEFQICLSNFAKNISPCFTEEEIDIQNFVHTAFDAGYDQLCGVNGDSNTEYLYKKVKGSKDCMQMSGYLFWAYGSCTAKLNAFKNLDEGLLNLNKQDICQDLESLRRCTTQVMEGVCIEEFSRFTELIFRPSLENCNNLNTTQNHL